jgi:hypothetical protein
MPKRIGPKVSMRRHALPRDENERAAVYQAYVARKAKFEREKEQRITNRIIRRMAYEAQMGRI